MFIPAFTIGQTPFKTDTLKVTYIKPLKPALAKIYLTDTVVFKNGQKQISAFTETLKSNYNTAYSASHTHTNYSALNNIISSGDGSQYLANDGTYKTVSSGTTYTGKVMIDSISNRQNLPTSKKISFNKLNNQVYPYQMTGNTTLSVDTVNSISGASIVYQILGNTGSKLTHSQPWSPIDSSNTNRSINTTTGKLYTWLGGCFGSGNYRRFKFNLIDSVLAPSAPLTLNAPGSFQATAASQTQINLSWTLPSYNGRNFQIYDSIVGISSNFTNLLNSPIKTATSYDHTGLSNGQHVYYKIRTVGNGTDTLTSGFATANATTSALTTLGTPTLSTPTVISTSEIDLAWSQVTNNSGYKVQISRNGSTYTDLVTKTTNTITHNFTTGHADSTYYFKVKALGDNVTYTDGAYSSIQSATTSSNPILSSVVTNIAGDTITATFSKAMSTISSTTGISVSPTKTISSIVRGTNTSQYKIAITPSFASGDVILITLPSGWTSTDGGTFAGVSGFTVTNNTITWSPTSIPNIDYGFNVADIDANGSNNSTYSDGEAIQTVNDITTNNNDLIQSTSGFRGLLNKTGKFIDIDGTDDYYNLTTAKGVAQTGYTLFIGIDCEDVTAVKQLLWFGADGPFWQSGTFYWKMPNIMSLGSFTTGKKLIELYVTSTNITMYINGSSVGVFTVNNISAALTSIFYSSTGGRMFNGKFFCLYGIQGILSGTDLTNLRNYINSYHSFY